MFGRNKYLSNLAKEGSLKVETNNIISEIKENGSWKKFIEWRMAVTTELEISKEKNKNEYWYRVVVKCDYEFSCLCPCIERAIEMAGLYQELIVNLSMQVGWPSWENSEKRNA